MEISPTFSEALQLFVTLQLLRSAERTIGRSRASRRLRRQSAMKSATSPRRIFRNLMGFLERTETETSIITSTADTWSTQSIFLGSYFGFEMYGIDFGEVFENGIRAFRPPSQGVLPRVPVVLPRLHDGSCEFIVNEQREVMDFNRHCNPQFPPKRAVLGGGGTSDYCQFSPWLAKGSLPRRRLPLFSASAE